MKQKQFFTLTLLLTSILCAQIAHAKIWRVNNNPGIAADFSSVTSAIAAAAEGDTLYIEASTTQYTFTQTKKLVLIGPGYFLSGTAANTGLQANPNTATASVIIDSLASGSQYIGLSGNLNGRNGVDDISVSRCNISLGISSQGTYANWKVSQSYVTSLNVVYAAQNWEVTNNICTGVFGLGTGQNCLVRNNTFNNLTITINSTYFTNNILLSSGLVNTNSTVKYNMANNVVLPAGNNNQNNIASTNIIVGSGSTDGSYQLKSGSPAIGAGETLNGITPDLGAFGTAAPYHLSGIPPIPTIYGLTVPSSIPSNASSINVTLSTRSNN